MKKDKGYVVTYVAVFFIDREKTSKKSDYA